MISVSSLLKSVGLCTETYRYTLRANLKVNNSDGSIEQLKSEWARSILSRLRVKVEICGEVSDQKSILFVGNHISYLDIPLLMSAVSGLSFVAKEELQAWPIFGAAASKVNTVFVKRESNGSRKAARSAVNEALELGRRIAIFPSGTTCLTESKPWRRGAFEIAFERGSYIQPFRIRYSPLRTVAYIDQDVFLLHLNNLLKSGLIEAKVEFHPPVKVTNAIEDCLYWQHWSQGLLHA